jgi:hypothetical protein
MKDIERRMTRTLAVVGGLLAAALLPAGAAFADEQFTPYLGNFVPTQVEGYPPLINVVTGTDALLITDPADPAVNGGALGGIDTVTTFGSFTNDDFLDTGPEFVEGDLFIPIGVQVDVANFGGGWENEWIDVPAGAQDAGVSDLLVTPFGDFSLYGSFFADLSSQEGL